MGPTPTYLPESPSDRDAVRDDRPRDHSRDESKTRDVPRVGAIDLADHCADECTGSAQHQPMQQHEDRTAMTKFRLAPSPCRLYVRATKAGIDSMAIRRSTWRTIADP